MAQHITVTDYQPQWPEKYREEEALLREILGENCLAVYHIGSTSVPGLAAKPILDIMPVVKSLEAVDAAEYPVYYPAEPLTEGDWVYWCAGDNGLTLYQVTAAG